MAIRRCRWPLRHVRATRRCVQGPLTQTGGRFDFAIEGEGFFLIETPAGQQLTRAGAFTPSAEGELVTPDGHRVLDAGGAPIFVPPDATAISVAADGTMSRRWPPDRRRSGCTARPIRPT